MMRQIGVERRKPVPTSANHALDLLEEAQRDR